MSEGVNKVILLGNLCSDPELRFSQGGVAVLNMRVATNESFLDKDKKRQERTEYHSVVVFGARAEGLSKFLTKGRQVHVEGRLQTDEFEKDGVKKYSTKVVAMNVIPCGPRDDAGRRVEEPRGGYDRAPKGRRNDSPSGETF